jgi:GAF domain-containing protein
MDDGLMAMLASAAREMHSQPTPETTIESAALLAVLDIEGCDEASVSIVHRRQEVDTPSASAPQARRADQLQYELDQGPCLDAIWEEPSVQIVDLAADPRWPDWGPRAVAETGFHSLLAVRLFTYEDTVGALNMYSLRLDGFTARDREIAEALAAQIAVAIRGAQSDSNLRKALSSRSKIGMCMGIVMERFDLSESQAFALLSKLATTEERRVVEIADYIILTRHVPDSVNVDVEGGTERR